MFRLTSGIAWLPPEPGSRGPIANVPITVQQALSAVAERRALKSKLVDGQTEVAEMRITEAQQQIQASPDAGSESEHDSDGEKLSGWSASSSPSAPGDQLPPDSSLEVSEASPQVSRKDQLGDVATGRGMRDMGSGQTDSPKGMRGESAPLKDSVVTTQLVTDDAASVESGLPAEDLGSLQVPPGLGKPSNSKISEPLGQLEDVLGYDTSIHQVDNAGGQGDANEAPINGWKTNSGVTQGDIEGEHTSPEIQEDVRFHTQRPDMQSQVERSYSVYISSEEEDDCLESLVPNALVTEAAETDLELENGIAPGLPHPCTALQEGKPILQVKRTPYVSGEAARTSRSRQTSLFSLPSTRDESTSDSIDGHMSADYVMSSNSIIPSTHYGQANPAASDISPPEFGLDGSTEYMNMDEDEAMLDQQIHSEIDAHSQRSRSISPSKERSSGFGSAEVGRESVLPPLLHPDPLHPMPSLSLVEDAEHSKRKAAESDRLSSFVTKRRKHIKPPPAFNFSQDNRQTQDPSLLARAHRREFFISRRLDTAKVAEGTVDKTTRKGDSSEESAEDANQSPDLLSAEVAPMQIDHHSPETDLNAGLSESACYQADNGPSVRKSRLMSRDYTPQNISLATGIDLDRPIKPAGSAAVQEPQTCTALPSKMPTPAKGTIYDLFRNTYPDYTGELKHFLNMCNRINALLQGDRMEHRSLWDDFIVRHKTEYRKYLFDCTDRGEDPIPYEKFYRDEVDEPKYVKRILTPASLKDAIASGGRGDTAQQPKRTFTGSAKISDIAASAVESPVRGPTPRTTDKDIIDLTLGYPGPKDLTISEKASRLRRSLPWINSAQAEKTPSPSRINKGTPRSSLIGQSAPLTQTPSRESRLPQKAAQGRTPGRLRTGLDQSPSIGQPAGIVNTLPDGHDFPPRLDTSESNLPSVVEWLHMTSSDRAPSPVSERRKPNREEPEEDQWWRDRNTPFKAFARAYARLKSIEGNLGTIDQEGILRAGMRQVDVLGWSF